MAKRRGPVSHQDTWYDTRPVSHEDTVYTGPKPTPPKPKPPVPPKPKPPPDDPDLDDTQRNAFELLRNLLKDYGIESLAGSVLTLIQKGYTQDTIMVMLQETKEYKARFKANEARAKAGLRVLSPSEYIGLENTYRQLLESYGAPAGWYDQQSDFEKWIAGDVAPQEIKDRLDIGVQAVNNSDPAYITALRRMGLGDGDLLAAALDRQRALPLLQKLQRASQIGSEALRQGLTLDTDRALQYADRGITQESAARGYQQVAEALPAAQRLSSIYGEQLGQTELEEELVGGSGLASQRRKRLQAHEVGQFTGSSGTSQKNLGQKSRGEY